MQAINTAIMNAIARLFELKNEASEQGQTLVEYALIIALVSVAGAVLLTGLKDNIGGVFDDIAAAFTGG
jgi:Flp pilus assembly pilin Flp